MRGMNRYFEPWMLTTATALLIAGFAAYFAFRAYTLWRCMRDHADAGGNLPFAQWTGMALRRSPVRTLTEASVSALREGIDYPLEMMEAHWHAGGDIEAVLAALREARAAGRSLTYTQACARDLARRPAGDETLTPGGSTRSPAGHAP